MEREANSKPRYDFIIIGAGLAGLQAGIILAEHGKRFLILEASDLIGGKVQTAYLKDVI